jgi:hypothetical protein
LLSSLFLATKLLLSTPKNTQTPKIATMLRDVPSPPLPDAPSAAINNNAVALALLTPPSPVYPALHRLIGRTNLFQDGAENCLSDLPLTGYSPAKKKVGNSTHGRD